MKFTIDTDERTLTTESADTPSEHPLYSKEAFEILSDLWVKVGWND